MKTKVWSALYWSFFEQIGQQGIQFITSIILARLLLPKEFGLIAILTIFMSTSQCLLSGGFGKALIQRKNATHIDKCSIFYFNIVVGGGLAGLLCLSATGIANFYNQPELVVLTYALSLNLIFNAFGQVQSALLNKNIDFKSQLKINIVATAISSIFGIVLALWDYGVWSLVVQSLSGNFLRSVFLWYFCKWRPSLVFSFSALGEMFSFGSKLLASGLLDIIFNNIYLAVIGKLYSPTILGLYSRANSLQKLPTMSMSVVISRVLFPVFSKMQDDKPRIKAGVRRALMILALVNFPLMIGLSVMAKPLIIVLFTEKWLPCVPYFQILCVVGLLYPLQMVNLNALTAQGRSDLFFRLEIIKKILIVVTIISTCRLGVMAMICGQVITAFCSYFINTYYTGKILNYSFTEQIYDLIPTLTLAVVMGGIIYGVKYLHITSQCGLLVLQVVVGMVVYIAGCYVFRLPSFMELFVVFQKRAVLYKCAS